ncbi:MAG: c-type cytochrome [Hyphomicrobiaceae bacterium]
MVTMKFITCLAAAWIVCVTTGAATVQAHKGATGIVKQRMDGMKRMGEISKAWGAMRKGKATFDRATVQGQAADLRRHAADVLGLFPKGSIKGPSEALPAIWQKWDDFARISRELEMLAGQLEGQAGRGKETAFPLMVRIGGTCSGCHKAYRKEKK